MRKYFQLSPINSKINFSALDCLRGLAATYVVFNHSRGNLYAGGVYLDKIKPVSNWTFFEKAYISLLQLTSLGNEFVIFFFILSGFSIAFSIHHSKNLMSFYKRRIVRIYPPYILGIFWAMLILLLIYWLIPSWNNCNINNYTSGRLCNSADFFEIGNVIRNLLYSPNGVLIPQYWSLPHEIIFYALIPLFIKSVKWYMVASTILFFIYIPFNGIVYHGGQYTIMDYILHYNFYFAIGVYLYYYKNFITGTIWLSKNKNIFFAGFVVLFLSMVVSKYLLGDYNFITELLAVLLSVICIKYFLNANYTPRVLSFFGKFSYTIYVGHFAALYLFKILLYLYFNFDGSQITNKYVWMAGVVFALLCCYGLYFLAEKPSKIMLNKLRKLSKKSAN